MAPSELGLEQWGIVGLIARTFIGNFSGTGVVCLGVGVGLGFGMSSGAQGIAHCRILAMDSTALVVMSP